MSSFPSTSSSTAAAAPARTGTATHVYLAGVGAVGTALLRQMGAETVRGPTLQLVGACTSRQALWSRSGLAPDTVPARLVEARPLKWPLLLRRLEQEAPRPLVFVDATGSPEVAELYGRLLRAGIHVVTPSKLANTQTQADFDRLLATAEENDVEYRYETTVGAGLPFIQTVHDLVETGDRVRSIRGAVSGTLTFLFSELRNGRSFSAAVQAAIDRGYAEPDVRDDLSGEDVARKFIILARTAGYTIEREDVQVESLVPEGMGSLPLDAFLDRLDAVDDRWQERSRTAAADDAVLQYVGQLSEDGIDVGVRCVPKHSVFGRLDAQDNLFEITTDRYASSPLTIQGPGAGPEVTAAGVLADIFKVATAARLS